MRLSAYNVCMSDGHGPHTVSTGDRSSSRSRRLRIAIGLNADVAALALSLIAVGVARRPPTSSRSFGWHRGTILAAQANAAMILALTGWILYQSIGRLIDPSPVKGGMVLIVALIAFVGNGISVLVVRERPEPGEIADLNMRSALLHLASDALASLGVAAAGAVMLATGGWSRLDPAVSLLIGLSIAWHAGKLLTAANPVLLEGTPEGVDPAELLAAVTDVNGVEAAHDLHVWTISSAVRALSVHIVVEGHPSLRTPSGSLVGSEPRSLTSSGSRMPRSSSNASPARTSGRPATWTWSPPELRFTAMATDGVGSPGHRRRQPRSGPDRFPAWRTPRTQPLIPADQRAKMRTCVYPEHRWGIWRACSPRRRPARRRPITGSGRVPGVL